MYCKRGCYALFIAEKYIVKTRFLSVTTAYICTSNDEVKETMLIVDSRNVRAEKRKGNLNLVFVFAQMDFNTMIETQRRTALVLGPIQSILLCTLARRRYCFIKNDCTMVGFYEYIVMTSN